MKQAQRKSFDWYKMQQRFSIRKYHFGAASVLLGTALILGIATNVHSVQAEEKNSAVVSKVFIDKGEEATKPAEVSTPKKETTYAAPTVANPVEVTPAKSDEAKAPAEKVEEVKEDATMADRSALDSSILATNVPAKVEATSATETTNEIFKPEHSLSDDRQNSAIRKEDLETGYSGFRSARRRREAGNNPDETPTQPASTQPASGEYAGTEIKAYYDNNHNGVFDEGDELISSTVIPPAPKGENGNDGKDAARGAELLSGIIAPTPEDGKDGDTYIDATTGDVYKKRDGAWGKIGNLRGPQGEQGQKGENGKDGRAPKIKVEDIAKYAGTTSVSSRSGIRITVYDDKNNNDEFDEGDTVLNTKEVYNGTDGRNGVDGQTPKVKAERDEAKKQTTLTFYIDKDGDGNYTEGTDTLVQTSIVKDGQDGAAGQAGRDGKEVLNGKVDPQATDGKDGDSFVNTATGDVFVKKNNAWEPAGNIKGPKGDKGENGKDGFTPEVTVTDNHDGSHTITVTQPEGRPALTTVVKNGENGQTPKVKAERDEAKKQTTLTFYIDKDGDGNYTEGTDTLIQTSIVKDGQDGAAGQAGRDGKEVLNGKVDPQATDGKNGDSFVNTVTGDVFVKKNNAWEQAGNIKGPKGDKGENGKDGFTPEVTVTDNHDGSHTITITQPEGRPALTTVVKNGENGQTPKVKAERDEVKKQTTLTFYIDKDGDGNYTEGTDTLVQTSIVKDGQDGAAGRDGQAGRDGKEVLNGKVDPQATDGKDGDSFVNTATGDVFVKKNNAWEPAGNIKGPKGDKGKNGKDGFTPEVTVTDNHDGSHTITVTQPEGRPALTTVVKNGENGQTPKVKAERDEAKKQTTLTFYIDKDGDGNYTEGTDTLVQTSIVKDGQDGAAGQAGRDGKEVLNGKVDPQATDGKNGDSFVNTVTGDVFVKKNNAWEQAGNIKGPKGDKGENGKDGFTPEVTVTDNHDGSHTITITQPEGRPALTTVVKNGENGQTPKVKAERDEAKKQTTLTFYIDKDGDGNYTEGTDTLVQTSIVKDGQDGAAGRDGQAGRDGKEVLNGKVDPQATDGKDGDSFVNTVTGDVFVKKNNAWEQAGNIKGPKGDKGENGKDGFTPEVTVTDNHDGSHTITITQPEGRPALTTVVKNGENGQTPKVKAERDEAKKQTTLTFYIDKDGDGNYTEGTDTLIQTSIVKDGQDGAAGQAGRDGKEVLNGKVDPQATDGKNGDSFVNTVTGDVFVKKNNAWEQAGNIKGPKGDKGENGKDGFTPEVTVTDNHDGSHTITVTQPEGRPALTTIVKNGENGQTPKVKAERDEAKKQTTLTFYIDKDGDGNYTEGTDTLVQTSIVKDGQDGAAGQAGRDGKEVLNGKVDPQATDGKDGDSFVNTATGDVFVKKNNAWEPAGNIKGPKGDKGENGKDGFTPEVTVTDNHDGSHTITITQPEGRPALTTVVKNGENGQTPKVKAERDAAKKQTTLTFYIDKDGDGNYTEGTDTLIQTSIVKDGQDGAAGQAGRDGKEVLNGKVDPQATDGKNGDSFVNTVTGDVFVKKNNAWEQAGNIKGPKGDKGENGKDGFTPEVTVTDNHDGSHTITITQPEGRPALTTVVKNGENGQTPKVKAERDEVKKQTTLTFYIDKDGDGNYTEGTDTLVQTSIVKDGQDGAAGRDGQAGRDGKEVLNGKVDPQATDGKDGDSFVNTATGDVFVKKNNAWEPAGNIKGPKGDKGKNGKDGFTPEVTVTDNHDGSHTITVTQPEGRPALTTVVKNGENGQTPKVKAERDEAKKQTTLTFYIDKDGDGNYTEGTDTLVQTSIVKDGQDGAAGQAGRDGKEVLNGKVDPQATDGKNGDSFVNTVTGDVFVKKNNAWEQAGNIKGPKGDKGENGKDGFTPEVTVTDNHDGSHTITITQPEGRPALTTVVKNGENGQTPKVKAERDEAKKQTTLTFYIDKDGDGNYTEGTDTLVQTSIVKDGQDGAAGRDGQAGRDGKEVLNGKVDPQATDGKDGDSFVNTVTGDVFVKKNNAWEQAGNIKGPKGDKGENGKDGFTPEVTVTDNHDGSHTITITQPEGRPALTTVVKNGENGQTPKVKAERDEAKKQTTLTFYIDKDGDGNYTEGTDTLIQTSIVKDGATGQAGRDGKEVLNGKVDPQATDGKNGDSFVNTVTGDVFVKKNNAWEQAGNIKGPKGDKGENGKDGFTPEVTVTDNHDGSHTITVTQPEGRPALTTIVKNGENGQTPKVKAERDEAKKQTTLTFYIDKDGDGNYTEGTDTLVQTSIVKDGQDGAAGQAGRDGKEVLNGKVDPQATDGKDGDSFVNTATGDVFVKKNNAWEPAGNIKGPKGDKGENGKDGFTPEVTVTDNHDGSHTITITQPEGRPALITVVKNGENGQTPKVKAERDEAKKQTTLTFYIDKDGDGNYTEGTDTLVQTSIVKDGQDGKSLITVKEGKETKVYQEDPTHPGQPLNPEKPLAVIKDGVDGKSPTVTAIRKDEEGHKGVEITVDNHDGSQPTKVFVHDGEKGENGQDGKTPTVTTQRGTDGHSTVVTITTPGKEPVTFTVRDGLDGHDGRAPKIDLKPFNHGVDSFRRARVPRSSGNNPEEGTANEINQPISNEHPSTGTHVTAYYDNNGNNVYDPGVDDLLSERDVLDGNDGVDGNRGRDGRNGAELLSGNIAPTPNDGKNGDTYIDTNTGDVYKKNNGTWNKTGNIRGPQGAKGDSPEVTAKPGADGHSTDITITTPGKDPITVNVKNGKDGKSLVAKKEGNETKIFVEDPAHPGQPLDATKPLATVLDGLKGDKGENGADGKSPVVTMTDNGDGTHSITVRNGDGSESTTKVKDGKDGKTATITTTENPDGSHTITVTNPDGTTKETIVKNGKDGKTPKVEVTDNNDGTHTVKVTDGDGNVTNTIIKDGKDGKAATATTTENLDGSHTVTITNPDGTKNEFVVKNGRDGVDGRTPTASVRDNGDGSHTIVITNPEGVTTETTVRDGKSPKVTITDEQNGTHKISVLNGDGTTTETIIKDGKSPVATVRDNQDGTYTIRVENGNGTVSETTVRDGKSPTAKVVDNGDGTHTITVVNSDGTTTTTTVRDGKSPKLEVIDNKNGSHTIKVTGADGKETTTTIFDGKSPKANIIDNGDGTHTLIIVDSDGREYKSIIKDGKDGVSPTVTVKNNNDGTHVVTITNPDGSKIEMVIKDGKDGKSPKVSVEDNGDGSHTITIINSDGTVTKTVIKDGKDGKCGCQDKPVTPSNDKPVPPTPNVPERPTFAMPEPPVYELPEFNGGVPGMPEVQEVPELDIPTVPAQPTPEVPVKPVPAQPKPNVPTPEVPVQPTPVVPTPEVPVKPVPAVPEQPVVPTPAQPATPVNANPVVPTTVKENHGDKLPETGSQSDYISVLLGSGILLSLYVGRRKED